MAEVIEVIEGGAQIEVSVAQPQVIEVVEEGPQGPPGPDTSAALEEHRISLTPHPAYDDIPRLDLIFENALI